MSVKVSIAPVRNEFEYEEALKRIDELFDAPHGIPEFDEFDILTILVHEYERRESPVEAFEPAAAPRHYLDRMELSAKELEPHSEVESDVPYWERQKRAYAAFALRDWGLDVIVKTQEEMERSRHLAGSVTYTADLEGQVIYSRG